MTGCEAKRARVGVRSRPLAPDRSGSIQIDYADIGHSLGAQCGSTGRIAKQQSRRGIVDNLPQPRRRISRIERQIAPPRLQDRQNANHHCQAAFQADRHQLVGLDPEPDQMMR
ncbi:hypothetical protein ACVWWR_004355 [Bradyrhizobium sp. LM3.2]